MTDANNVMSSVMQYSTAGGTLAAAIGYRVLSTIVDLGVSNSASPSEDSTQDDNVSTKATSILTKDWFWKSSSSTSKQYSASGIGIDRETSLPLFTLQEVSYHDMPQDCWVVLYDRVYDITSFLDSHPGGDEVMLEYAGHDATLAFRGVGHSSLAEESLKPYLIGILVESERIWTRFFNMS